MSIQTFKSKLSTPRAYLAATHIGEYALFGGGEYRDEDDFYISVNNVDIYDKYITRTKAELPTELSFLAATHVGDYALFGGGQKRYKSGTNQSYVYYAYVYAFNRSLTRTNATNLPTSTINMAATHIGDYALFGGGEYRTSNNYTYVSSSVFSYNSSLTLGSLYLNTARTLLAATHIGEYALFGGGNSSTSGTNSVKTVEAFNESLTRLNVTDLVNARYYITATHNNNYALFSGGYPSRKKVDAYDSSLSRITPTNLTNNGGYWYNGSFLYGYALFVSTDDYNNSFVEAYDDSLIKTIFKELDDYIGSSGAGTHTDNYALFGGGNKGYNKYSDKVYAFTILNLKIQQVLKIYIPIADS